MHLVWQKALKMRNLTLIMKSSLVESLHRIPGLEDVKFKAHLVAKGYTQKEGMNFNEVFSLVVKHSSIRVLFIMVALFDLKLEQLDIKIVFLHDELEE
ncbi:hypothetical protein AAG906_004221 [Vitis piasezkii]